MKRPVSLDNPASARKAFSLIEVTIAIGLVSFSLLAILGLLPIGLSTVREAVAQSGEAAIVRQLRSSIQQNPLSSVQSLDGQMFLFNRQGMKVSEPSDAYFSATLDIASPEIVGASTNFPSSAQVMKVALAYPHSAPAAGRQTNFFALLVSRP